MQTNTSMKNLDDMTAEVIGLGRQAADRALAMTPSDCFSWYCVGSMGAELAT